MNHFYDPVHDRGLSTDFAIDPRPIGSWQKSKEWAQDTENQNRLTYKVPAAIASILDAIQQRKLALVSDETDFTWREALRYLVKGNEERAMFALGHVLHLIEDTSVPDHTRNDLHDDGSPYENWTRKFTSANVDEDLSARLSRGTPVILGTLEAYFDGLAVYSNNNFYSKDTIGIQSGYSLPQPDFDVNVGGVVYAAKEENGIVYLFKKAQGGSYFIENKNNITLYDDAVMSGYWSRLSTKAVQYGAGVIDLFFKEAEAAKSDPNFFREEPKSFIATAISTVQGVASAVGAAVNRAAAFMAGKLGIGQGPVETIPVPETSPAPIETAVEGEPGALPAGEIQTESLAVGGLSPEVENSVTEGDEAARLVAIRHQLENIADLVDDLTWQVQVATVARNVAGSAPSVASLAASEFQSSLPGSQASAALTGVPTSYGGGGSSGASQPPRTFPKILINEIQLASASSTRDEFVELYNPNDSSVDLTDWYVQKKTASGSSFSTFVPASLFVSKAVPARGYFLIAHPSSTFAADVLTSYGIADNNTAVLKNPNGDIVDKVGWGSANDCAGACAPNPADGGSIQRKFSGGTFVDAGSNAADFELQSCPSPKAQSGSCSAASSTSPTATSTEPTATSTEPIATSTEPVASSTEPIALPGAHVLVSEIMAGASGTADGEWVELYNPTDQAVSLAGWSLKRKATFFTTSTLNLVSAASSSGVIAPKSFFLIASRSWSGATSPDLRYSQSSNHLAQSEDVLLLYDAAGNPVDEIAYASIGFGESVERKALASGSACISPRGNGEFLGNGCTATSTDAFEVRSTPNPQSAASFPEPRAAPATPAAAASAPFVTYTSSSLTMSFAWVPSADYASATSMVRYEMYDVSNVASSTFLTSTTSTEYSYRVSEVGRSFSYALRAIDRDGLSSAIVAITIAVPSFLDNLYFYRDPRASGTAYLAELYYPRYPYIPQLWSSGNAWRMAVLYLNRTAPAEEYLNIGERLALDPALTGQMVTVKFKNCAGTLDTRDTFLVFPDASSACQSAGSLSGDISSNVLEDNHVVFTLASSTADVAFASSTDYLTAAFYDFWPYSVPRMFSLVAVDKTKYYFRDTPPVHAAPVLNSSTTVDFDEPNSRLVVRWEAATDPDTLDSALAYEINFSPGGTLDEMRWQSASPQPRAQADNLPPISYNYPRTVSPGDAFAIGVRAKDEFGDVSNVATSSWAYPATVFSIAQESANGWSDSWGTKRPYYENVCPDTASLQSITPSQDVQFNRAVVRVWEEHVEYGYDATLRLAVYGEGAGASPDFTRKVGEATLGGLLYPLSTQDITFSFASPVSLSVGAKYWLVLDVGSYGDSRAYQNRWQNAVNAGSDAYAGGEAGIGAGGACSDLGYCSITTSFSDATADWYFKLGFRAP
ncbi:MAG: lamin tail domain-containing protein [Candidatus Brennerbacteria bacterium]